MSSLAKLVGSKIREIRKRKGLTQEKCAEKVGLHYSYFGGVERGTRNISMETLEKIIMALEISPAELFDFDNDIINYREFSKNHLHEAYKIILEGKNLEEIKIIHSVSKDIIVSNYFVDK